jgi:ABC-type bacteriocin/lantibiotic exporter with double-glycine peptidase domain
LIQIVKDTWNVLTTKEKKQFRFLTALDILISVFDILFLIGLLWLIHFYIQPAGTGNAKFLTGPFGDQRSVIPIAVFFILFSIKNLAGYRITRQHYLFYGDVAIRISQNNLAGYQQSEFDNFINTDSSVHIRKIAFQPFEFCQYILAGIQQVFTQSFLIFLAVVAVILFNAKLFLILLIILLPPVIVVFRLVKKKQEKTKRNIRSSHEKSFQHLMDALKGYIESNIYHRNDFFMNRFIGSRNSFSRTLFESLSLQSMPPRIIEIFAVMGLFILISIASLSGFSDTDMLLTIGAFVGAAYKIIPGAVKIINISGQLKAYEHSVADLSENMLSGTGTNLPAFQKTIHSVELKDISFNYPTGPVLSHLYLRAQKGDFIGITGESGKGKTTILNLLLGFLQPAAGEILVNNIPAKKETLKNCWPLVSYVRQQPFLIHDTLARNITLEESEFDREKFSDAILASGLDKFIASLPGGLETIISENGRNISGGQQQRIMIARALYKQADLILLDEPFNELDEISAIALVKHFKELSATGKIIILVTHDSQCLGYCNKIISLDEL